MSEWDDKANFEHQEYVNDKHWDRIHDMIDERKAAINMLIKFWSEEKLSDQARDSIVMLLKQVFEAQYQYNNGHPHGERRDVMPRNVDGRPFRCECGANVFSVYGSQPNRYFCNGCETEYIGESVE